MGTRFSKLLRRKISYKLTSETRQARRRIRKRPGQLRTYKSIPLQYPDSIRLLTLFPGEMDSPIEISLAEVRFQDDPLYEALSYTWATEDGDSSLSCHVTCEGEQILVTENCDLALRYLRKADSERVLWIDAICINQNDLTERGHQVSIMREVYSNATEVIVWLGEASDHFDEPPVLALHEKELSGSSSPKTANIAPDSMLDSPLAGSELTTDNSPNHAVDTRRSVSEIFLEFLGRMAAEIRHLKSTDKDPKSSPLYQQLLRDSCSWWDETYFQRGLKLGFLDIVGRRWWSRVWVIQEIALARSVTLVCSKLSVSYTDFSELYQVLLSDNSAAAIRVLNELKLADDHHCCLGEVRELNSVQSGHGTREQLSGFLNVLCEVRCLESSNPLDKVYGLLGLSEEFKHALPKPDYNKTAAEVFTNVAKAILTGTQSLGILTDAGPPRRVSGNETEEHPSWVPYWSDPPNIGVWKNGAYKASRNSKPVFDFSSLDRKVLRVKGHVFDCIQRFPLANPDIYAYKYTQFKDSIPGWRISCDVGFSLSTYPTGEPVEEALWRTMCWNYSFDMLGPASNDTIEAFRAWYRILTSPGTFLDIGRKMARIPFGDIVNSTSPLCATSKGYLAAAPCTSHVGDRIVILAGVDYPFVLRPFGAHYRLVGACYVHGIMGGQAFPEDLEELEWFDIH